MTRDEMVEIQVASTVLAVELGRVEAAMQARLERVSDLLDDAEVLVRNFPNNENEALEGMLRMTKDARFELRELLSLVGGRVQR